MTLTYAQLDARANRLANRLRADGVGPDVPVAVLMSRSPELVVALLAIGKAGGCYVPLHDSYPLQRQQWIVDQVGSQVLLVDPAAWERGSPAASTVLVLDEDETFEEFPDTAPEAVTDPDDLAYIIFTSGSTGDPKGVAVSHRNAVGLVHDSAWTAEDHERVLVVAPHAFNVSTYEYWVPLSRGGRVVLAPPDAQPDVVAELLREQRITTVHLTAGLFRVLAEEAPDCFTDVRQVLTGGDVIAPTAVERVLSKCPDLVVRAMYGSTETTVFATHAPTRAPYRAGTSVPVGSPLDEVRLHLLDDRLSPVPHTVTGEIYLAGRGVSRGYSGRPDLTAERFVADPFAGDGTRMYRTGDLARVTESGQLELAGREGDQVKILGFRVELAEVEAVLAQHPAVVHTTVLAADSETGGKTLIAFVVPNPDHGFAPAELRAHAKEHLPGYMVPATFVELDELPLTANGKIDRAALPAPVAEAEGDRQPPRNPLEARLCEIFGDVLGAPQVGIHDSFFDLGGQSLLAMRLISRFRSELGVKLHISVLFDAPTVAALADHIVRQTD
ncbi:non-ribosomal peptide synthetase [Saccharopolyspora indica]